MVHNTWRAFTPIIITIVFKDVPRDGGSQSHGYVITQSIHYMHADACKYSAMESGEKLKGGCETF